MPINQLITPPLSLVFIISVFVHCVVASVCVWRSLFYYTLRFAGLLYATLLGVSFDRFVAFTSHNIQAWQVHLGICQAFFVVARGVICRFGIRIS